MVRGRRLKGSPSANDGVILLGNRSENIGGLDDGRDLSEALEPAAESLYHLPARVKLRKTGVDREAEARVPARQDDPVGLERKLVGEQRERARVLGFGDRADEQQLVARECVS